MSSSTKLQKNPYDGYDEWYSTGQSYRDTEDDSKKKIFCYTFAQIHRADY